MRTIPTDSTDAREQRAAEADADRRERAHVEQLATAARAAEAVHAATCQDGWLGETAHGELIPCVRCRPHLAERRCSTCSSTAAACTRRTRAAGPCCDRCAHGGHRVATQTAEELRSGPAPRRTAQPGRPAVGLASRVAEVPADTTDR